MSPLNKAECHTCTNENCLIKKHYKNAETHPFIEKKHTINCKKSQQFILEGAPVYGIYFIYDGLVKVSQASTIERNQIIRFSTNGEIVGHRGFGIDYVYNVSASALEDTILCNFPTEEFNEMLMKNPQLMYDFMLFYADQLQKSESNSKRFSQMTVREKVISAILLIKRKFGAEDGFLKLTLSRKDIAEFAGTTEEQVIKVISQLKKENLLKAKGKKLGVDDEELLESQIPFHKHILPS